MTSPIDATESDREAEALIAIRKSVDWSYVSLAGYQRSDGIRLVLTHPTVIPTEAERSEAKWWDLILSSALTD